MHCNLFSKQWFCLLVDTAGANVVNKQMVALIKIHVYLNRVIRRAYGKLLFEITEIVA